MIYWHGKVTKTIYNPDDTITIETELGYHCNSTSALEGCDSYSVTPTTPYMQALGVDSFFYVFSDKEQFLQITGFVE